MKLIIISFLLLPLVVAADVPHYDIIEVLYNGKKYFVAEYFNEEGVLKNHDLCYYDYNGNYIGEVKDYVLQYGQNQDSITLFSSIERINVTNLSCFEGNNLTEPGSIDNVLKILNNGINVSIKKFKKNFQLLDAYHGNTSGFTHTPELNESDNIWLNQYPIENLFCVDGNEICNYGFFSIKGNLSKMEKRKLEKEIKYLLSSDDLNEKFWKKISALYRRNIIMMGFCSC